MDKAIDAQFQRVDKALSSLINSIATYNPNPSLATELAIADQELSAGLQQLSQHQRNHAKLLSLRSISAALDDQIRSTLQLLSSTRTELLATPAAPLPTDSNPVSYAELLSYARRISRFTIPPGFREAAEAKNHSAAAAATATPVVNEPEIKVEASTPASERADSRVNGDAASASTPAAVNSAASVNGAEAAPTDAGATEASNTTALPPVVSDWLNPLNDGPAFVPWPVEETIRRGALASIQILLDQGVDPATFDPERSAELEAERKRLEEEQDRIREEQREREMERQRAEAERRALAERRRRDSIDAAGGAGGAGGSPGGAAAARVEEKKAVFTGLDLLDEDDE